jgi:DNA-binding transcriptional ArsR family regulator
MNILSPSSQTEENSMAELFSLLGNPARLQILLLLGNGEACVCHLKEALSQRQAYISQQLMILRKAGLVSTMRKGRHIYYRLKQPEVLEIVRVSAELLGADIHLPEIKGLPGCPYPGEGK